MNEYYFTYTKRYDDDSEQIIIPVSPEHLSELEKLILTMEETVYEDELGLNYLIESCQVHRVN